MRCLLYQTLLHTYRIWWWVAQVFGVLALTALSRFRSGTWAPVSPDRPRHGQLPAPRTPYPHSGRGHSKYTAGMDSPQGLDGECMWMWRMLWQKVTRTTILQDCVPSPLARVQVPPGKQPIGDGPVCAWREKRETFWFVSGHRGQSGIAQGAWGYRNSRGGLP